MSIDFEKIINNFTSFDKKGSSAKKIDTYLEFYKLGDYLNGNNTEGIASYNELDNSIQNQLQQAYKQAQQDLTQKFLNNDSLMQIDDDLSLIHI